MPQEEPSLLMQKWNTFITFMEDNRQKVFYLILFYCICLGLFVERYMRKYIAIDTDFGNVSL